MKKKILKENTRKKHLQKSYKAKNETSSNCPILNV